VGLRGQRRGAKVTVCFYSSMLIRGIGENIEFNGRISAASVMSAGLVTRDRLDDVQRQQHQPQHREVRRSDGGGSATIDLGFNRETNQEKPCPTKS
jgi:hypothetical protein